MGQLPVRTFVQRTTLQNRRPRFGFIVIVFLVGCGVVAAIYDQWRLRAELADMRRTVSAVRQAAAETRSVGDVRPPPIVHIVRVPVATASSASGIVGSPENQVGARDVRPDFSDDDYKDFVEKSFERDSYDPAWALQARRDVESRLSSIVNNGTLVERIDCRSTMCRVALTHHDEATMSAFREAVLSLRWPGGIAFQPEEPTPNGSVVSTLMVMREGIGAPIAHE